MCVAALLGTGCEADSPQSRSPSAGATDPPQLGSSAAQVSDSTELIVLGLDGATFHVIDELIAAGRLPNFERLIATGARAVLNSERPLRSPPIWTTIATGRTREDHGIESFFVETDDGRKIPVTSRMRKSRTFWEILAEKGVSTGIVGWWPSWPADSLANGFIVADRAWPIQFSPNAVPYGARRDSQGQLAEWDMAGRTWPPDLFEEFRPFILTEESVVNPRYTKAIFGVDAKPSKEMWNAYWAFAKDHTFFRAGVHFLNARSPRVFVFYLEGPDVMSHYYWHYRDSEGFEIDQAKRELFGEVVNRYYVYCDGVIAALQEAAGKGASIVVVSDHGFTTFPDLKERWERGETIEHGGGQGGYPFWHDVGGIFLAAGPGFAAGEELPDASIYDVAPTILYRMDTATGADMPGKILASAFSESFRVAHHPRTVPTWERKGLRPEAPALAPSAVDDAILEKLKSLGYVN